MSSSREARAAAARAAGALVDALFPRTCVACAAPAPSTFCALCNEAIVAPAPDPTMPLAPALFGGPLADAIRRAKYGPDAAVAELLAAWLVDDDARATLPHHTPLAWPAPLDAVTFVPAPWRRRALRGFDFPALLAQAIARQLALPVVDALACTRTDAPLSFGADKLARAAVVAGRYRVRPKAVERLRARSVLLVDDVRTTGATLNEARRMLEGIGATVHLAVLAIAP